jgi:hypothetical protein
VVNVLGIEKEPPLLVLCFCCVYISALPTTMRLHSSGGMLDRRCGVRLHAASLFLFPPTLTTFFLKNKRILLLYNGRLIKVLQHVHLTASYRNSNVHSFKNQKNLIKWPNSVESVHFYSASQL